MSSRFEITRVIGREILDSRGNPTVEAIVYAGDVCARAAAPAGASTGRYEAVDLRDGDAKRYGGLGVLKAVHNIEDIIGPKLRGFDARDQARIDRWMIDLDGTENKSRLGANATTAVSWAAAKLAAKLEGKPLYRQLAIVNKPSIPVPIMNVINGGKHSGSELKVQEFIIVPVGAKTFAESVRIGSEVYHALKGVIERKHGKGAINVGDEGGFAPPLNFTEEALTLLLEAISLAGYSPGGDVSLGMDPASSEFYDDSVYNIDKKTKSPDEMLDFYLDLIARYPIRYLEDPFEQEDFQHTAELTRKVDDRVKIVGDDIFVTNQARLQLGISKGAANTLLVKVNQIGTLTEAFEATKLASSNNYSLVVSHRSGETEDTSIADLSVALNSAFIKSGAPCRSDRTSKYNRLIRIEQELGPTFFQGSSVFQPT